MKYKDFIEMARKKPGCCDTESLNERFQKYLKYKTVDKKTEEEEETEPEIIKEALPEIKVTKTDTKKWLQDCTYKVHPQVDYILLGDALFYTIYCM